MNTRNKLHSKHSVQIDGRERNVNIPAVYALLIRDGKLLLTHRINTGYEDGKYVPPSGHVESGETYVQALIRETAEEVGVTIKPENIHFVHLMHRQGDNSERVDIFFSVDAWSGVPYNGEPKKCDEVNWFPLTGLPDGLMPYIAVAIKHITKGITYSEFGWNIN